MAVNLPATWLLNNIKKLKAPRYCDSQSWKEAKQECFVKLYIKHRDVSEDKIAHYVNAAVENTYSSLVRKKKKETSLEILRSSNDQSEDIIVDNLLRNQTHYTKEDHVYNWQKDECREVLKKEIKLLPGKQKKAVLLFLKHKYISTAAKKENLNLHTLTKNYQIAVSKLKQRMKGMKWD